MWSWYCFFVKEYHQACLGLWTGGDCPLCRCSMFDKNSNTCANNANDRAENQGQYESLIGNDSNSENNFNILPPNNSRGGQNVQVTTLVFPVDQDSLTINPVCSHDKKSKNENNDCSLII